LSDELHQQDLFGVFAPAPGVHRAPPAEPTRQRNGVVFERSTRARHYRLTLRRDGTAVAVIPARGSVREAERFVALQRDWLERARARQARRPRAAEVWTLGTHVLWRGEMTEIRQATLLRPGSPLRQADGGQDSGQAILRQDARSQAPFRPDNTGLDPLGRDGAGQGLPRTASPFREDEGEPDGAQEPEVSVGNALSGAWQERPQVCLAADVFRVPRLDGDLRPTLEAQFARRGRIELPARAWELAAITRVNVTQVTVRNQRSRWGSCSVGGTISLNWRLVQTPDLVRDYIIHHELMHLHEMNHSAHFWARVEEVYPEWREAEEWLKRNGSLLGL
jgi:predicted metal-dependent hydrolase